MAISFPQTSDIFSLSFSVSPFALRHCGDKISIPFLPPLLPPSMPGQEVRTTGTEERRERETIRKMGTKEDIKRKRRAPERDVKTTNERRAESDRQRKKEDSKTKTAKYNGSGAREKKKNTASGQDADLWRE